MIITAGLVFDIGLSSDFASLAAKLGKCFAPPWIGIVRVSGLPLAFDSDGIFGGRIEGFLDCRPEKLNFLRYLVVSYRTFSRKIFGIRFLAAFADFCEKSVANCCVAQFASDIRSCFRSVRGFYSLWLVIVCVVKGCMQEDVVAPDVVMAVSAVSARIINLAVLPKTSSRFL